MEQESQFEVKPNNVIKMKSETTSNRGIMKPEETEEKEMSNDTYSKREIDDKFNKLESKIENLYTKNEIDLKFENLEQKISSGFENMTLRMENLLLEFKADSKKEQESNKKWLIGIAISIIGLLVTTILKFL